MSPLEARLSRHLALTFAERDALRWLERRERDYAAGAVIVTQGEDTDQLYIVGSGWLHGSVRLPSGGRQILRFYFAGDITTTFSIAWAHSAETLTAVSRCTLFQLPRSALGRLFQDHPRLGALLYGISASENVAMADRLTSVGRSDAVTRVATLLLDIRSRLRAIDGKDDAAFELPLTQQDIGDTVGLTKTHVNRSLKALETAGLIERDGRNVLIPDAQALAARANFVDRYWHVATDWLPATMSARSDLHH